MLMCRLGMGSGIAMPDQPASPLAHRVLSDVQRRLCPSGCGSVDLASNEGVGNAMAMMRRHGHTSIRYSRMFMNRIAASYGQGAAAGIFAHEFGHHIDFLSPASWMSHSWGKELRADGWAGCYLARAGLGANQMEMALRAIAQAPSMSHPGWPQRVRALRQGYGACGGHWRAGWGRF